MKLFAVWVSHSAIIKSIFYMFALKNWFTTIYKTLKNDSYALIPNVLMYFCISYMLRWKNSRCRITRIQRCHAWKWTKSSRTRCKFYIIIIIISLYFCKTYLKNKLFIYLYSFIRKFKKREEILFQFLTEVKLLQRNEDVGTRQVLTRTQSRLKNLLGKLRFAYNYNILFMRFFV
jgi:hypothetical protein